MLFKLQRQIFYSRLKLTFHKMTRHGSTFKVLNVAEKNDAAKRISDMLSGHQFRWREGFSKFNKIYEFDYHMLGQHCQMTMTSLSGHLLNYEFVGNYRKWTSCHPVSLFDAEIEKQVTENMIKIKKTLEKEIRPVQALVIWTDCDREGENIGYEIIDICRKIKPNVSVYRAKFSEITDRSMRTACENLVQPDKRVSDAVDVRQELDLRIGAAFTRFQTLRLQKVFPNVLADKLISYGSCQFPTLGFVVERYKARESFQPEDFWKIEVKHITAQQSQEGNMTTSFSWKRNRLFDELACRVLHSNCTEHPAVATVTDVNSRPRSRWRPVALETVELEKLASRKLRINAKETMKIAEKLYTQGFISYPRTETNIFPTDIDLRRLVEEQTQHQAWGDFARRLLDLEGGPTPRNGRKTDKAHPPIHPTKFANSLSGNEARIYELIVRHFLACCHRDAQGHETTVEIELGLEKFSAQGLMIIAKNYLEVYHYDKWNAKVIPVYQVGDEFEPSSIDLTQGQTTAPPLLAEADLIALMDKHGIGTDATHAEHIETIKQRMYVGLTNDQRFLPGELGMGLVEGYNLMGYEMSRPELRAELESDLRKICEGQENKRDVLRRHISKYRTVFQEAVSKAEKLDEALGNYFGNATRVESATVLNPSEVSSPVRPCPSCGKDMIIKRKKDGGYMVSCMGYPSCTTAAFLPKSVISISVDSSICPTCQPAPVHRVKLKLHQGSVPAYFDCDQVACIGGCDEDINNVLGIRYKRNQSVTNTTMQAPRQPLRNINGGRSGSSGPGFLGGSTMGNRGGSGPNRGRGGSTKRSSSGKRKMSTTTTSRRGNNSENMDLDTVTCNCGSEAVKLTVRKEGANTGRQFYKCSKTSGSCDFFTWADAPQSSRQSGPNTQQQNRSNNRTSYVPSTPSSDQVMCRCNVRAVERTVMKDGANKGRAFLTCDKPRDEQCGFFEWADSTQGSNYQQRPSNSHRDGSSNQTPSTQRGRKPPTCSLCKEVGHTKRGCPNK